MVLLQCSRHMYSHVIFRLGKMVKDCLISHCISYICCEDGWIKIELLRLHHNKNSCLVFDDLLTCSYSVRSN